MPSLHPYDHPQASSQPVEDFPESSAGSGPRQLWAEQQDDADSVGRGSLVGARWRVPVLRDHVGWPSGGQKIFVATCGHFEERQA